MRTEEKTEADALIQSVVDVCRRAAELIMAVYAKPFEVRHKPDQSPVTEADLASDALINRELGALTPEYPVLSEESARPCFELRSKWRRYWLVDPLDGTQGFVSRRGDFTINVALVDRHVPVLGVVYVPEDECCYYARAGGGAYRAAQQGGSRRLQVTETAERPIRVVTSRSRRNPATAAFIESLGEVRLERMGSALKSCRVAEGSADIYPGFSRTSEWDTAAAQCIVEEAGGKMIDTEGSPLRYNVRAGLQNPRFLAVGDTRRDWIRMLKAKAGGER
jgi:3'(2'), 5'-bisphosphate nucleotidase